MTDDLFSGKKPPPDDEFTLRTFDTGSLEDVKPDPLPEVNETTAEPFSDDDFVTITVEPVVSSRPARPVPPPRRAAPSRHAVRSRYQREPGKPRAWISGFMALLATSFAAILVATIFSLWTSPNFFSDEFRVGLNQVQATQHLISIQPSPLPTDVHEVRIGIVAGHSGPPQDASFESDPGAVCEDGLTEKEINETVARHVVSALTRDQYTVELLNEFDPKLENYKADVLVSVHTNSCDDYGFAGTGYNVASASARETVPEADERLLNCMLVQYGATTGLPRHTGITIDMTDYHTFREVSPDTPTAIIEIGFMRNDRAILTGEPERIAQGIANGVRCFLRPDVYGDPNASDPDSTGQ
jgi:N-acetylmuramoyl-L-alanine amidase